MSRQIRLCVVIVAAVLVLSTFVLLYAHFRPRTESELRDTLLAQVPPGWHTISVRYPNRDEAVVCTKLIDACFTQRNATYHCEFEFLVGGDLICLVRLRGASRGDNLGVYELYNDGRVEQSKYCTPHPGPEPAMISEKLEEVSKLLIQLR
jgi:hypothetical protein